MNSASSVGPVVGRSFVCRISANILRSTLQSCCSDAILALLILLPMVTERALAGNPQLNENCVATVANRNVQVNPNGSFAIANVPADVGLYRVRVTCKNPDHTTSEGQSSFISLVPNGNTSVPQITFGAVTSAPVSLKLTSPTTSLGTQGQTVQLTVTGTLPNGSTTDLSTQTLGTLYVTSNSRIATVSVNGLVTAMARGKVVIT